MNILDEIKLIIKIREIYKGVKNMNIKSGWKTTEFWVTVATILGSLWFTFAGSIPPLFTIKIIAIITAVYGAIRMGLKALAIFNPDESKRDSEILDKIVQAFESKNPNPPTEPTK